MFDRLKSALAPYEGRYLVDRPDARKEMDPEAMSVMNTPARREAASLAIEDFFNELEKQGDKRPTWATRPATTEIAAPAEALSENR